MWLTGWDFGTYNNFHRWVARIATAQAIVHSIGYTVLIYIGTFMYCRLIILNADMKTEGGWEYYVFWWSYMFWWVGEIVSFITVVLVFS